MSDSKPESETYTWQPKKVDDTSPPNRSRSNHDGRPLQTIITEKAIHGAVPTEYALLKPSVWHSTQWQFEETLAAVRFSDGSTTFLQAQTPAGIRATQSNGGENQKPSIGSVEKQSTSAIETMEKELGSDDS